MCLGFGDLPRQEHSQGNFFCWQEIFYISQIKKDQSLELFHEQKLYAKLFLIFISIWYEVCYHTISLWHFYFLQKFEVFSENIKSKLYVVFLSMVMWVSYKTKELIGSAIGTKYLRMGPVKFVENSLQKISRGIFCLKETTTLRFFKGCLPKVLLCPFLNTLPQLLQFLSSCS